MLAKRTYRDGGPIAVDAQFLNDLEAVLVEVQRVSESSIARKHSISSSEIQLIKEGNSIEGMSDYKHAEIRNELKKILTPRCELTLSTGTTIEHIDFSNLAKVLSSEPEKPKSLTISIGEYDGPNLSIEIPEKYYPNETATYKISGEDQDIFNIRGRIERVFANAECDYKFLYGSWLPNVFSFSIWLLSVILYLYLYFTINDQEYRKISNLIAQSAIAFGFAMALLCYSLAERFKKQFPKVSFNFGREKRRTEARRIFYLWLLSSMAIPIALAIVSLWLS